MGYKRVIGGEVHVIRSLVPGGQGCADEPLTCGGGGYVKYVGLDRSIVGNPKFDVHLVKLG